jgi:FixJ family two-component response regulator
VGESAATKVLLVEDDESLREAMLQHLKVKGYECVGFASAEALLARGGGSEAACVVCDIRLPGKSGLDLVAEMRTHGGWPPTILITAWDAPGLAEQARCVGAAAYLVKPIPSAVLLAAIESAIERAA